MEPQVPVLNGSFGVNVRPDSWSANGAFDNVLALLDEERSRQLVQQVIPAVTYTGSFEVVGEDDGLDPPTELCSPCKRLIQRPPPIYSWSDVDVYEVFPPARFWIPHHDTLFQLIDCCFSRVGNCRLCQLLWHGVRRETFRHRVSKTERPYISWHDGGLKVALHNYNYTSFCIGLNVLLEPIQAMSKNFYVRMVRKHSPDAVELRPLMAETTDSPSTSDQIKKWVDYCLENHSLCRIPGPSDSERPTRLILLHHLAGTFQLTADFAPDTKYAAISYRWGSGKGSYMLTQETAGGMRQGVSMARLPKTLHDTCTIAHRLELKYVWIDRLCIFQDSQEDWSQEASRMAFIYKHAFLTISASCAADESQGCFRKRNPAGFQPLRLISNPLLPSNAAAEFQHLRLISGSLVRSNPPAGFHESSYITIDEPEEGLKVGGKLGYLADRGWVFQERIISQRILHFAQEQVYWECRELEASEAWPEHTESFLTPRRPSVVYGPGKERWEKDSLWHEVVGDYSVRQFTYEEDKLPALSGLARDTMELRKGANDKYLAGLWRSTVLCDLCWGDYYDTPRIPERYLAPSWSWASLHAEITHSGGNSGFGYRPWAKFKDARLKFATADSYGAVHDGWIHLFGHLMPVTVDGGRTTAEKLHRREPWPVMVRGADGNPLLFLNYPVGKLDVESFAVGGSNPVPMFCLPVLKDREDDPETEHNPEFYCLLLVPNGSIKHIRSGETLPSPRTGHADEYQRAGLARITVNNWLAFKTWLAESPERDIVIR